MPANNATTESGNFSAGERAAMKKRAAELRAEGKKGARKAGGLQGFLDSIAAMAPQDRVLAERVHVTVTAAAPGLSPKTWYGMPASSPGTAAWYGSGSASLSRPTVPPCHLGRGEQVPEDDVAERPELHDLRLCRVQEPGGLGGPARITASHDHLSQAKLGYTGRAGPVDGAPDGAPPGGRWQHGALHQRGVQL
jgi:hypothetical protein